MTPRLHDLYFLLLFSQKGKPAFHQIDGSLEWRLHDEVKEKQEHVDAGSAKRDPSARTNHGKEQDVPYCPDETDFRINHHELSTRVSNLQPEEGNEREEEDKKHDGKPVEVEGMQHERNHADRKQEHGRVNHVEDDAKRA